MPGFEVFGDREKQEIKEVLQTGILFRYEFGEQRQGIYKVRTFEENFARYVGAGYAQAVTSGTAALKVALAVLGVGPGDEVVTQGFTFVGTWEAILDIGAIPVFTEIDTTLNMDPADLERKITGRTKAIIPVHMLGSGARIDEIMAIADRCSIPVIEDVSQAAGGKWRGSYLGTFGRCGAFSFGAVKTITTGEGGMVVTDDEKTWRTMAEYHDHGHDHVPNPGGRAGEGRSFIGFNYRMMELQGAIGIAQLGRLDDILLAQRKNKELLRQSVGRLPGVTFRTLVDEEGDSATFLAFFLPNRERAREVNRLLRDNGAGAISFVENKWNYYPKWEHLANGATTCSSGWPFKDSEGRRKVVYDPENLFRSAAIMNRLLAYQVPVKLSRERLAQIDAALEKAAAGIG
jgi:8-amino-3,8-dideoxy-alpha-D-manno-octulosonate transaminase